jgi:sugar phosphate isomerase/epimerase
MKAALLLLILIATAAYTAETNPFFAMDTVARGEPEKVVPMLKELGYDGLGGAPGDAKMATALKNAGLRYFNGYITLSFSHARNPLDDGLKRKIDAMKGRNAALWMAIQNVELPTGKVANSSLDGDELVIGDLRQIADYASQRGVKIAIYPHASSWLERVEDAIRVADKLNHVDVGVTFNLCHWLKMEGSERDPEPVLRAALPRLMFVTINGADTGDTKSMGWDRLIQPLGRGTYDTAAFLKTLNKVGYKGPIGFQGYRIPGDPRSILAETMTAWRKLNAK